MTRTFIEVPLFTKRWSEIGLTDKDLLQLQIMLLKSRNLDQSLKEPVESGKFDFLLKIVGRVEVFVFVIQTLQNMRSHILSQLLLRRNRKTLQMMKK